MRAPGYQAFFSRFINHEDRGYFFAELNNRLEPITWQPVAPGDPRPTWRENPNQRPDLQMAVMPITGDLWVHLYQSKLNKILNDARVIAVSTATVDRRARWALWDSFAEIASALLNIAAFIALPFVPFLGELMLAYIAYQLLDETFEGVVDWAEGLTHEAFDCFMGMVESAVQLGTFAAGGAIAVSEFRAVLPQDVVQFIDRFNSVQRPNGEARYWKPDLTAYEHSIELPQGVKPDAMGLHQHQGKTLLTLENNLYSIKEDPLTGQHRIEHPTRSDAYRPGLRHNDSGAWQTELDQPLTWDQATLLRRIGPDMQRFSANERERMLFISGCPENTLRKMHVNAEQVPPLLADTLKRFKIDQDLQIFTEQIGSDRPDDYLKADPVMQLELLCDYGYWPADKGLRLVDASGQIVWERVIGDPVVVQINQAQLENGDLLGTLLPTLDESAARSLRRKLAELTEAKREILFSQRYRKLERSVRPLAQRIIDTEPGLPGSLAEALLDSASAQERQQLGRGIIPKRLADQAREASLQVRVTRAYEGLDLHSTRNHLDTDRLALHTLERLPGWSGQLRLEVRQYTHEGQLIDSIGIPDAAARKVLVLTDEGAYQAFDDAGEQLSGTDTLYSSLLRALPDNERIALNINIGEGERLKQMIRAHALNRETLRALLAQQPNVKPAYDPAVMRLLGGADGYRRMPVNTPSLQSHIFRLFPHLSADELEAFAGRLQRLPGGPRAELQRLFNQHAQLFEELSAWRDAIPLFVPDTQTRLNVEQYAAQRHGRRELTGQLLDCWRRQATHDSLNDEPIEFNFSQPIWGALPRLNVDFPQVIGVQLEGHRATHGVDGFLHGFSGLQRLALRNFNLGQLPEAVARWPWLSELILSDCAITLTEQNQIALGALSHLQVLDLYNNPLGSGFSLATMPDLNYIDLSNTGLTELPGGLLTRPRLRTALLNDNRITELPAALFSLSNSLQEGFDLGGNPVSAAGRERIKIHFQQTRRDFGIFAQQADIQRLRVLYPRLDQEEASEFIYRLPGTLAEGRNELARLETEYDALRNELAAWTADIPALHPASGEPFTPQQLVIEHATRDEFKQRVESCWRRETELDDFNQELEPSYELTLTTIITGDLPALHADFSHVSVLYMQSDAGLTSGTDGFLQCFSNLKSLTLRDYTLHEVPEAIFRMGRLTVLALSECDITLSAQSVLELAQLERLDYLDLSNNPLGLAPDLSQMPDMSTLMLANTGITELPPGLLKLTRLDVADLSDNAISHIPHDILELPLEIAESINLRGNPLDKQSVQTLIAYFRKTSTDFGVEAVIEQAEMEVSTSEDSEPDE